MGSMGKKGRLERAVLAWVLAMAGACSPANPSADVALVDASAEGAMDSSSGTCTSNRDCDDQLFCNGVERCMPGSAGANARGCTTGTPPCAAGNRCSEALAQCMGPPSDGGGEAGSCDEDGDGVQGPQCGGMDCDDHDPYRAPNQRERCDGMLPNGGPAAAHDEDCDPCTVSGSAPDGDSDGDGYARTACINPWRSAAAPTGCDVRLAVVPASSTVRGQDCNDDPAMRGAQQNPGTAEVCGNGVDDNCDGLVDNEGAATWFEDRDGDGYGNSGMSVSGCARPDGGVWVQRGGDCNDNNADYHPGAPELCDGFDNNCDLTSGTPGGPDPAEDGDGDGHTSVSVLCIGAGEPGAPAGVTLRPHDDCDDRAADTYGGAPDYCDRRDTDCSLPGTRAGGIDAAEDNDGDGHAPPTATCIGRGEPGAVASALPKDDCDDNASLTYPTARELCDLRDNDCVPPMGLAPGGAEPSEDMDGDGHSARSATCVGAGETGAPAGVTLLPRDDCNDARVDTHPGAPDWCDRRDTDCSSGGGSDTNEDYDFDGHASVTDTCLPASTPGAPAGTLPNDDCNDRVSSVFPGALEYCDGYDSDCSLPGAMAGGIDRTEDTDGDAHSARSAVCVGRGEPGVTISPALVFPRDDCDDAAAGTRPGATELCDRIDNDCSLPGAAAGGPDPTEDQDGDGYAPATSTCFTSLARDCDDTRAETHPSAPELCDRRDNNCSLPSAAAGGVDAAEDADGDGHTSSGFACVGRGDTGAPPGLTLMPRDDCDDTRSYVFQGAPEYCDRRDDDCSLAGAMAGGVDVAEDQDNDGHAPISSACLPASAPGAPAGAQPRDDCDDGVATTFTGAPERCDGVDNNCDGRADEAPESSLWCGGEMRCTSGRCEQYRDLGGGFQYSCALRPAGTAWCFGANSSGQLGTQDTVSQTFARRPVATFSDFRSIAFGDSHACGRRADGTVACWGANASGQLGDGSTTTRLGPVAVSGLTDVVDLSARAANTCAVTGSGAVWCWGSNSSGQLGIGTSGGSSSSPRQVVTINDAISVSVGWSHACARRRGGGVWCWGVNFSLTPLAVAGFATAVTVSAGFLHTCALLASGAVWCLGDNRSGQLGDGTTTNRTSPVQVQGLAAGIVDLSLGNLHSCARYASGALACWGDNGSGQLGDGTTTQRTTAVAVLGLSDAQLLAVGYSQTCARSRSGSVYCWGSASAGGLGDNHTTGNQTSPTLVLSGLTATQVAAHGGLGCALDSGRVFCWGDNARGQVGDGTNTPRLIATPVVGLTNAATVSAGNNFACARRSDGTVACWGDNTYGQLGDGTTTGRNTLAAVSGLSNVSELAVGLGHVCARQASGAVLCWGNNADGQLGDGTTTNRTVPTATTGLSAVAELALGDRHSCARQTSGAVVCWGNNASGQLGDGTVLSRVMPQPVSGLATAATISAGAMHSCAVLADGTVLCWGRNAEGQLGNATQTDSRVPVGVTYFGSPFRGSTVFAGDQHTCGTSTGMQLFCWGRNAAGELGIGNPTLRRLEPSVVPALSGTPGPGSSVGVHFHSCALDGGGTNAVYCWGPGGATGPLGDNINAMTLSPLRVLTPF